MYRTLLGIVVVSLAAGCGGGGSETAPPASKPTAAAPPAAAEPGAPPGAAAEVGAIVGSVSFDGTPPEPAALDINKDVHVCGKMDPTSEDLIVSPDGGIRNAVVYLVDVTAPIEPAGENPVIDQKDCRYDPHVLLVPAGATVDIRNSDGIMHNVHTYSSANEPFNMAQPKFKPLLQKRFDQPEMIEVTCDVHGWMKAWIVVQQHPFYVLTDPSGNFRLTGVPAGDHKLVVWHETLGQQSQEVTVKADAETELRITMKQG
jgi:plastocyanin